MLSEANAKGGQAKSRETGKDEKIHFTSKNNLKIISDVNKEYEIPLDKRIFNFAVSVLNLLTFLPYNREFDVFKSQLSKSSTSIGANYEESQAGTYKEFYNRVQICLRESRETKYFLAVLNEFLKSNPNIKFKGKQKTLDKLVELNKEIKEISNIFGAISKKVNQNLNK